VRLDLLIFERTPRFESRVIRTALEERMSYYDSNARRTSGGMAADAQIDAGLRVHMQRVYSYMAGGLALTGIVAYAAAVSGFYQSIAGTALIWVVMLAPLGFVLALSFGIRRMSAATATLLFWVYAAVMGLSLGGIFLVYTGTSIARVFFITASTYAAMSLYGYTTKTDLSGFGSFLLMGLIGIVIASLVNIFIGSSALQFAISIIGVVVFVGLTAYDTQRIKEMYLESDIGEIAGKKAVLGALALYLDFINLFMMLLQLFGQRREN
jgi:FtsH-binding integral membrane protein